MLEGHGDADPDLLAFVRCECASWHAGSPAGLCFGLPRPSWPDRCTDRWNWPMNHVDEIQVTRKAVDPGREVQR